jgi:hypothetical protein
LQSWTLTKGSQILWINGIDGEKQRESFTNQVKIVVTNARDFDVNTMYFSCDPYSEEYNSAGSDASIHKKCLLDLVYVLIWQLVQILPDYLQTRADFSTARFSAFDEEYRSLNAAVNLLQDLLELAPPVAIVVLHGIELLSHPSVKQDVKYILQLLILYAKEPDVGADVGAVRGGTSVRNSNLRNKENELKMLLTTVTPCQALTELYQQYEGGMKEVMVSWQKWHQYGQDINLFNNEATEN